MLRHKCVQEPPQRLEPQGIRLKKCPRTTSVYSHRAAFNVATTTAQGTIGLMKLNVGVATPSDLASVAFRTLRIVETLRGCKFRLNENSSQLFALTTRLTAIESVQMNSKGISFLRVVSDRWMMMRFSIGSRIVIRNLLKDYWGLKYLKLVNLDWN